MEVKGGSQRWRMHLPEFKQSRRCSSPTAKDSERGKTQRDRGGPYKSVSLAPTSRYLTDRQYVMRKPLFSAEQHTSILKKTHPQKHTYEEKHSGVSRAEHTDMNFLTRPREKPTPPNLSLSYISSPSAFREDHSSQGVSELKGRLYYEEPTFRSPFSASRSAQRNSILEVQRLNPPLRPQLTSTVLNPTYTARSGYSRPGQIEGRGQGEGKLYSSGGRSKGDPMSPYQTNYWACAIPKTLPPSPDRHSADWDPNREYQTLLDYTYPLRPRQVVSGCESSEFQGDSLLQTDLQDSGIGLDHLCSSTNLSGLYFPVNSAGQTRERSPLGAGHRSPDLLGFTRSSDGLPSDTQLSLTDPVDLTLTSLDCTKDRGGLNCYKSDYGHHHQHHALSSFTSTAFIRSTSVLPQHRYVCREVDEEFWPLPEQLEELQLLSRQVREVTAQLSRPVTASWESLEPGTTSILSSITLPEKQEAKDEEKEDDSQDTKDGEMGREERNTAQMAAGHRDSEAVRRISGAWVEPVRGGLSQSSLREVEALVEQLHDLTLPGSQGSSQEHQEQSDSLIQHIQVFCSHLGQLIQQLHTVLEKMELLAAPTVDINGVKSSLAEYQTFQVEVNSHQPLISSVLHSGQLLLSCINTTSPLLRDTLLMIERQSEALQTYTEHLFSSILFAMDSLTQPSKPSQPSLVQQSREEDLRPVGAQQSTL